jgi:uncharacterized protein (TIGR02246 family)
MDIPSNGVRIHVTEQGDGDPALVFLHYYGGSARTWRFVMDALSSRWRTVATDHRGWGASEAPADGYRIEDLADDAQGVIEAMGLRRFVLVGHSMGGKAAQLLASRRPPGLEGLVLVAPSPPCAMRLSDEQRAVMAGAYASRESVEWVLDHVLTATRLSGEVREQVVADSLRGAPQARQAWPNVAMLQDITREVAAIDVPVLVVSGDRDQVDRIETLREELLPRIADARLHMLPGVGHLSPLEAPSQVAAAIEQFVEALESSPRTPGQLVAAFDRAFNAADLDRLADLFAGNATMRMTDGTVVRGREAIRAAFQALLATRPRIANRIRAAYASDDLALALAEWTVTSAMADGSETRASGVATQVLERGKDGRWRLRISNPLGVEAADAAPAP